MILGPIGHPLHKVTLSRLGDVADIPITHRKTELGKMRRQRNTFQTKEQDKTSEKELNKMKISN